MKISVAIQQGKEVREAIITLTKNSNAEYVFKRLFESGWLVVETKKLRDDTGSAGFKTVASGALSQVW